MRAMKMGRPLAALAGAAAMAGASAGPAEAAGLLDFLFGSGPQPQQQVAPAPTYGYGGGSYRPLEMRVSPRGGGQSSRGLSRPKVAKPKGEPREKVKLAKPIDPKANPGWYLDDPTLRRGDIIVLKDKVLVYEGGRGGASSLADFASLRDSKLVPKGDRAKIEGMAGIPATTPVAASTKPVAAAEPVPVNVELSGKPAEGLDGARVKQVSLTATE